MNNSKVKELLCTLFAFLLCSFQQPPLGMPEVPFPENNRYSPEKAELGRMLYFDPRLSTDGTISCSSCHLVPKGFTDQEKVSTGIHGREGFRNAPTVINTAYNNYQFWDGRAKTLEEQAVGPLANRLEMSDEEEMALAFLQCEERINSIKEYKHLFLKAFGSEECTIERIAKAIATFERTILSGNSRFDKWQAGNPDAMTPEQIQGWLLFQTHGCISCHGGPNFTDGGFANIGVGMDQENPDLGRYDVTKKEADIGKFKTPTLREVAYTFPYMHDGSIKTLEGVVDYYDRGGIQNGNLSKLMSPLHLSKEEKHCLVEFLHALSGEGWQHIQEPAALPQ